MCKSSPYPKLQATCSQVRFLPCPTSHHAHYTLLMGVLKGSDPYWSLPTSCALTHIVPATWDALRGPRTNVPSSGGCSLALPFFLSLPLPHRPSHS